MRIAWKSAAVHLSRIALAGATVSSACRVGPRYTRPTASAPLEYKEGAAPLSAGAWKLAEPGDTAARGAWWDAFNDPRLNDLERRLDGSNQNIAAGVANVQIARAMVREARAQFYPLVTTNPSVINSHVSAAFGRSLGATFTDYSVPVDASWEPDLFGRVRMSVESGTFAAQAAFADLENVRLSAQAELAADYYGLRAQDALRQVLDSTVNAYRETLDLTRALFVAGRSSDEAVAQAEAQLRATEAQATNLGVLRAQYEHAIAVLVGVPPSTFAIPVEREPFRPPVIPPGVPSALLERRPDIAAAERTVAQANAQIGVARTAFFPTVTLDGSAGVLSTTLATLFTWPSRVWSVGPSLLQTIFDGGARKATVDQYRAAYDQTVATYRQTVLIAFQQVEDNLAALRILAQEIELQDAAIGAAQRGLQEADVRYRTGIDPYLNVLVAQTTLLNLEQTAVNLAMQRMVASVQLIKALGGGWDASRIPSP